MTQIKIIDSAALESLLGDVLSDERPALHIIDDYPARVHHVGGRCGYCGHERFKLCVCSRFGHTHRPRKAARHAA
jgi:hypothetical protein